MFAEAGSTRRSELVRSYHRDGYVVVRQVLSPATLRACREHLDRLSGTCAVAGSILAAPLAQDRFLAGIARGRGLTDIAASLLGARPEPFAATYIVKPPRRGLPAFWHQDGHPWQQRLGITSAVTLWIALDPVDRANGGLCVVPGSQGLEAKPLRPRPDQPSVFGAEIDPLLVDTGRATALQLAPGDLSAHGPRLIHGSPPNRSARLRRALAVRYRPAPIGRRSASAVW